MNETTAPKNIRISTQGDEICEALKAMDLFPSALDAYRAAIAVALGLGLEPLADLKFDLNKWDTGSVFRDPDRNIESLLALYGISGAEAVSRGMQLAEVGLRYLNDKRIANVDLLPILVGKESLVGG